jgi:hypothetical protein
MKRAAWTVLSLVASFLTLMLLAPLFFSGSGNSDCLFTLDSSLKKVAAQARPDTVGIVRDNLFLLRNSNTAGDADLSFVFGDPSDIPLAGDWDGDGVDTIGVYRSSTAQFFLRNSNSAGEPDIVFAFGTAGDVPIVGDWNGDGVDTIGVYRPSTGQFFLRNALTAGFADFTVSFGPVNSIPIAGDWNGDGNDSVGVFRKGIFYLANKFRSGCKAKAETDFTFAFGAEGDLPLAGDWDGDGIDTIGIYSPQDGTVALRNSLFSQAADLEFSYGAAGGKPITGVWVTP